jgi:hypothetical protein
LIENASAYVSSISTPFISIKIPLCYNQFTVIIGNDSNTIRLFDTTILYSFQFSNIAVFIDFI